MKKHVIFAGLIGLSLSSAAMAAPSYLLQLGSFAEQSQAENHWKRMEDKYPDLLDNLNLRVAEVQAPGGSQTVYRTQAVMLEQRRDAEVICDKLAREGDECFIVETAMVSSPIPTAPNAPQADTARMLPPVEAVMPKSGENDSAEDQLAAMEAALDAESEKLTQETGRPLPPAPTIGQEARVVQTPPVIEPGTGLKETQTASAAPRNLINPTPIATSHASSLPMSLNPNPAPQPVPELPPVFDTAPQPVTPTAPPAMAEPAPLSAPIALHSDAPRQPSMSSVELPPPPAFFDQPSEFAPTPAPVTVATASPVPENAPFRAQPAESFNAAPPPPSIKQEAPRMGASQADVAVSEAIRVPLTETAPPAIYPQTVPVAPTRRYPTAEEIMKLGSPSVSTGTKQMWAKLSYFGSETEALKFWEETRQAMTDLPMLRVRVTKPYTGRQTINRVSLKVGPFEHASHIRELCNRVEDEDLYCQMSNDLGSSTLTSTRRDDGSAAMLEQQYAVPAQAQPMYWLQVGTFDSPQAAWENWQFLQQRHTPILDPITPQVITPETSSASDTLYRMRVGPYTMRTGADQLCDILKRYGTQCVTVFAR